MPELPEVEAARNLVHRACVSKIISQAVIASDEKVIDGISSKELEQFLTGKKISAANRKGKYLWFQFDGEGRELLLHFGMTGQLQVEGVEGTRYVRLKADDSGQWPPKFWKLHLELEDGTKLAFCDARRFARVKLLEGVVQQEPVCKLGWDALEELPAFDDFKGMLAKYSGRRSISLKALLLDQAFSAGIGNWCADEVLYQARLHPEQPVGAMSAQQLAALHGAIQSVMRTAVEADADAERFPKDWLFHHRWGAGKQSVSINGHKVEFIKVGSRTSAYVPDLQRLSGESAKGGSGSRARGSSGKGAAKGKGVAKGRGTKRAAADDSEESDVTDEEEEEEPEEEEEVKQKQKQALRGKRAAAAAAAAPEPDAAAAAAVRRGPGTKVASGSGGGAGKAAAAGKASGAGRGRRKAAAAEQQQGQEEHTGAAGGPQAGGDA